MVDKISKPGVNITQTFAPTPVTPVAPALVPCVVGPAFQVVDVLDANGDMNSDAMVDAFYKQGPLSVSAADFNSPLVADPADQVVLPDEVSVATQVPGLGTADFLSETSAFLTDLPHGYAPALFLPTPAAVATVADLGIRVYGSINQAPNAALAFTLSATPGTLSAAFADGMLTLTLPADAPTSVDAIVAEINGAGLALTAANLNTLDTVIGDGALLSAVGSTSLTVSSLAASKLIVAIDLQNTDNTGSDQIINLLANQSPVEIATAVNAGRSTPICAAYSLNGRPGVVLYSSRVGASGRVTLRDTSSSTTNTFARICLGTDGTGKLVGTADVRGAGLFAAAIDADGVSSDLIQFTTGATAALGSGTALWHRGDSVWATQSTSAPNFKDEYLMRGATASRNGDLLTAVTPVGAAASGVMIRDVRSDSFRLCSINTALSTYDGAGGIIAQRYTPVRVGTLTSADAFAPKDAFVVAQSLTTYIEDVDSVDYRAARYSVALDTIVGYAAATAAEVIWTLPVGGLAAIRGQQGDISVSVDGVTVSSTYTIPLVGTLEEIAALIAAEFNAGRAQEFRISATVNAASNLVLSTQRKAADVELSLPNTGVWAAGTFVNDFADVGSDNVISTMSGETLQFAFNGHSDMLSYTASGPSLDVFIADVNTDVGYAVLSLEENTDDDLCLVLRSPLVGLASSVSFGGTLGELLFADGTDFAKTPARPNPQLRVRNDGSIDIAPDMLRSVITGTPIAISETPVYVGYRALRLDVSPAAGTGAAPIEVSSVTDLTSLYGPVSARNPLALAMYFALINGGAGQTVTALGVDAISAAEPEGTTLAYARAFELLRAFEVHTLVPLTRSENVIALADAHVKDMSAPENRMERTCIGAPANPLRENDAAVLSTQSEGASNGLAAGQVILDANPTAALALRGIIAGSDMVFELASGEQLYLQLNIGDDSYRYSVLEVSGTSVVVRPSSSLTPAQNGDGFYSSVALPAEFANADYSLALRGKSLYDARGELKRTQYAETIRNKAQQYANRRQLRLYPESVQTDAVGGIQLSVPSYYWGAALAGAAGNALASQPFTRTPLVGFNGVDGPRLERAHLDIISAGNAVIEIDRVGEAPALRLQSTTDVSSIETREWSVTRAIDLFAKRMRIAVLGRIGRFNITNQYISDLRLLVTSVCNATANSGVLRSATPSSVSQNKESPDTVDIVIAVEVLYPANYINVTINV